MASTSGTSYITTASEQATELYNNNRDYNNQLTWQGLVNQNDASARMANSALLNQYNQATAEAYVSSLQSKQALQNSGIVGQYKNQAMDAYNASLNNDLTDLQSSYNSAISDIESSRSENESNIENALYEQAQYTADYTNAHYDYLQYLYDEYQNGNNTVFNSTMYQKYLGYDYQRDENGTILTDEEGNYLVDETSAHLKSWDELTTVTKDEYGEYSSIYDENGNLTQFGIDFFDQMENSWDYVNNDYYGNNSDTWSTWLRENNEDLYDWAGSYNYYNYTQAGTNAGTVRTMYGMMSTDMTYSYLERMGGMTSSQVNAYFDKVNEAIDNALNEAKGAQTNVKSLRKASEKAIDAMEQMTNDLGLGASMAAEGFSWDTIRSEIDNIIEEGKNYQSSRNNMITEGAIMGTSGSALLVGGSVMAINIIDTAATAAATAAAAPSIGASIGAALGTVGLGAAGTIVTLGLVTLGTMIGMITSQAKKNEERKMAISKNTTDVFSQFAVQLTDYKNTLNRNSTKTRNQVIY